MTLSLLNNETKHVFVSLSHIESRNAACMLLLPIPSSYLSLFHSHLLLFVIFSLSQCAFLPYVHCSKYHRHNYYYVVVVSTLQSNDFAMMIIWQRWRLFFNTSCSTLKDGDSFTMIPTMSQWFSDNDCSIT